MSHLIHATALSINDCAVLITGASGSGKSSLGLQLISLGAKLIADDQVFITHRDDGVWASKPEALPALIEARKTGLISVPMASPARVGLVVNLDLIQTQRLPEAEFTNLLGENITVWRKSDAAHFPATIFLYLNNIDLQGSQERENENTI